MTNNLFFSEELFSDTRLNQFAQVAKSIKNNLIMQNKPNPNQNKPNPKPKKYCLR